MFSRKKPETEDRKMSDAPDDLGIPMKPARSSSQSGTLGRVLASAQAPGRPAESPRGAAEPARPLDAGSRQGGALLSSGLAGGSLAGGALAGGSLAGGSLATPRGSDADLRRLIVGREISLSGDISSCDKLIVEGSVEANLQNCREVDISETGMFKGSATIDEIEVRGRFEGNLVARKRLLVRATGRVSGTIRYGQIEIERGGQIAGDVQAQSGEDPVPEAHPAF